MFEWYTPAFFERVDELAGDTGYAWTSSGVDSGGLIAAPSGAVADSCSSWQVCSTHVVY